MSVVTKYVLFGIDDNTLQAGARRVEEEFERELKNAGLEDEVQVVETGSMGIIKKGVVILIEPDDIYYTNVTIDDVKEIVNEHLLKGRPVQRLKYEGKVDTSVISFRETAQEIKKQKRVVLANSGVIDPENIEEYIAVNGYEALAKAVTEYKPEEIVDIVKDSSLRGRGGAGFPTGLKWSFTAPLDEKPKYLVCNADEGEPGTFKDRLIMEGDPHKLIEGMAIAGYAIGAEKGYIYIRGEYKLSIDRTEKAIKDAKEYGILGENIFGSDFNFDIEIKIGAGAYVCGEETALLNSLEGGRGNPRVKPPFPGQKGLWDQPTVVNNVETLANVPSIIRNGSDWYKELGTENSKGTKVYTILGHVNNPGLIEVEMGTTLRDIIYKYAGGVKGEFKCALVGGAAGAFIGKEMLDVKMDYDHLGKYKAVLGSGAILVMNQTACIVDMLKNTLAFFNHESCGKCTPCRVGNVHLYNMLDDITKGKGKEEYINNMVTLAESMQQSALCALGQSAYLVIDSATRYFEDEILEHIERKVCPQNVCEMK